MSLVRVIIEIAEQEIGETPSCVRGTWQRYERTELQISNAVRTSMFAALAKLGITDETKPPHHD